MPILLGHAIMKKYFHIQNTQSLVISYKPSTFIIQLGTNTQISASCSKCVTVHTLHKNTPHLRGQKKEQCIGKVTSYHDISIIFLHFLMTIPQPFYCHTFQILARQCRKISFHKFKQCIKTADIKFGEIFPSSVTSNKVP